MPDDIERDAKLSDDEVYRYWLTRSWSEGKGTLLWTLLNPSVADGTVDDPTIGRIVTRTRSWGFRTAAVCNLFALISTSPRLLTAHADPVGPDNDAWLAHWAQRCAGIVCAWGAHRIAAQRATAVFPILRQHGAPIFHLGLTKEGYPKHPLYLPYTTTLHTWPDRELPAAADA